MEKNKRPIPSNFIASMYGGLHPTSNPMVSRARLAMFYRDENRNSSFISDEVADMLIARAIGTPIVGLYDTEKNDFLQHAPISESRTYGYIPESHNFAWEWRVDDDGVEREYACFDVHLLTGRYAEAREIVGKKHSMELDPETISGSWQVRNGRELFVFSHAQLSGACVLGQEYEPCFEGSQFFSLNSEPETTAYLNKVREGIADFMKEAHITKEAKEQKLEGGTTQMKLNFGWVEDSAQATLFSAINPNFTEEKGWLIEAVILSELEDGSYLTYNFESKTYEVYTSVVGEDETASFETKTIQVYSQEEYDALAKVKVALDEANAEFSTKIEEQSAQIATLEEEKATFASTLEEKTNTIAELEAKVQTYVAKDAEAEEMRKDELLNSYTELLPETELQAIVQTKADFTYDEIEAKLAISYTREMRKDSGKVPVGQFTRKTPGDELVALLSKYKK